ncbi:MAG: glycosyltransferase family 39 protein [Candidatus Omnitrophica bacterium]|nr:glycosyltransferase family 39 protein [Candidatus Omnitrophota bacterium]
MKSKHIYILLLIILGLGALLRFYQLGAKSLWTDELATMVNTANIVDFKTFLEHTVNDDLPKFYSLLLKFWITLGNSEFFMRALSVIFGILSIWVVYVLSRLFFDAKASLSAAFLTAISPFLLLYDREIRVYSLFTLLSLLATYLFVKSIRDNKKYLWLLFTAVSILNVYTHYYAFLTLGVQWLFLIIRKRSYRQLVKPWLIANCTIFLFFMVRMMAFIKDIAYFAPWAIPRERFPFIFTKEIVEIFYIFFSFTVGQTIMPWNFYAVPILLVTIACFVLGIRKNSSLARESLYLLLLIFVPVLIGVVFRISLPRYFMFIAPLVYIFIAKGIWVLPKKVMVIAGLVIILGWGYGLKNYYTDKEFHFLGSVDPWREVGGYLKENVREKDALYCLGLGVVPLRHYYNSSIPGFEGPGLIKKLESLDKAGTKRIWLIFTYQEEYESWLKACAILSKDYTVISEKKWGADPDYKLKKRFFKKNFLPYRIIAQLYERKL